MKSILVGFAVLAGILAGPAQTALADDPTKTTTTNTFSGDFQLTCDTFAVDQAWTETDRQTQWVDSSGNVTGLTDVTRFNATLLKQTLDRSQTLGTYRLRSYETTTYDGDAGTLTSSWMDVMWGPHWETIFRDAGRQVTDLNGNVLSQSGSRDPLFGQPCMALA